MGKMQKLHSICWVAGIEYRKWLTMKHFLILLFSIIFLGECVFSNMRRVAQMTGLQMGYLEPMGLVMSFEFYIMVIPLVVIVELSGFPDKSAGNLFVVMRSGRIAWLLGEVLFGVLVGITCLVVFFAASFAWVFGVARCFGQWSPFMSETYVQFPEVYGQEAMLFLEPGTLAHGTPASVTLVCICLLMLYVTVMVQALCLFQLLGKQKAGLFFNIGVTVFGAVAVAFLGGAKWLFPMAHAIFGVHFDKFFSRPIFPLQYSIAYFVALNAILLAANMRLAKRCTVADGVW